ncbi:MerR family transcriptional regulator [Marinicauda pacifica]|jgi:MerR family transcriptional regulator, thiopeptide resistance regulator|uniref:MerR family transcriptional regulator n=1 Tax=Marinicauda pacifica TaxID=1133559 RepID=UPI0035C7F9CD
MRGDGELVMGIGAAARACGLTPRALRWWEAKGLLQPRRDPVSGRRRYGLAEMAGLQRVLALKSLGLPLDEIDRLIRAGSDHSGAALAAQVEALRAEKRRVERALAAVESALEAHEAGEGLDASELAALIRMTHMTDWTSQEAHDLIASYYTERQMKAFAARDWSDADRKKADAAWAALIARAETLCEIGDPESEAAQALGEDWVAQVRQFTGGDAEIEGRLSLMWCDLSRWPDGIDPPFSQAVHDFVGEVLAIRCEHGKA